jgi:hypothetical protein
MRDPMARKNKDEDEDETTYVALNGASVYEEVFVCVIVLVIVIALLDGSVGVRVRIAVIVKRMALAVSSLAAVEDMALRSL